MRALFLLVVVFAVSGCVSIPLPSAGQSDETPTNSAVPSKGQNKAGSAQEGKNSADNYGYHPLDPLPIDLRIPKSKILDALPDETIRIAVGTVSAEGAITFGPAKFGVSGSNYVVILDYIKFGTDSFGVAVSSDSKGVRTAKVLPDSEVLKADVVVPVYIGVGLRLTANILVKNVSADLNLGSLFALGVAAKAGQVSGTLVIQTLGVSGPEISGLIPMPGEISESTIQNAILALASIKAKIYDPKTLITPRVVGVFNNLGGGDTTINGVISTLLQRPLPFPRSLKIVEKETTKLAVNKTAKR
ncbi:hypothetical protein V8G57_09655 [Collimonas sp. H4R21]|uniref:Lipoprotein n=1 Tax=Collimonas rhizosphaerae TaxID=3126357 RepID=A0ABU9PUH2_9BURK